MICLFVCSFFNWVNNRCFSVTHITIKWILFLKKKVCHSNYFILTCFRIGVYTRRLNARRRFKVIRYIKVNKTTMFEFDGKMVAIHISRFVFVKFNIIFETEV